MLFADGHQSFFNSRWVWDNRPNVDQQLREELVIVVIFDLWPKARLQKSHQKMIFEEWCQIKIKLKISKHMALQVNPFQILIHSCQFGHDHIHDSGHTMFDSYHVESNGSHPCDAGGLW